MFIAAVSGTSLSVLRKDTLVSNSSNIYKVLIVLDSEWIKTTNYAILEVNNEPLEPIELTTDNSGTTSFVLPAKSLETSGCAITLGLVGKDTTLDLTVPTIFASLGVIKPGAQLIATHENKEEESKNEEPGVT